MEQAKAIEKIRNITDQVPVTMMTTLNQNHNLLRSRPMQVVRVDDDAAIWFFTDEYAGKTETLKTDNPVSLTFSHPEKQLYLSLIGHAYLVDNEKLAGIYWNPVLTKWFPETHKENLLMIKFVPESAEYWQEEGNVWKRIFYAGKALMTGDTFKKGQHERVTLSK